MSAAAAINSNHHGIDNASFVDATDGSSGDFNNVGNRHPARDELDICEVDYERDPTDDDDDGDDQDADNNEDDLSSKIGNDLSSSTSNRCCAEAAYNCSIFSKTLKVEVEELKASISSIRCPSPRQLCTVERISKRLPIIKWLPTYRQVWGRLCRCDLCSQ